MRDKRGEIPGKRGKDAGFLSVDRAEEINRKGEEGE
jgi:hypothetical protein